MAFFVERDGPYIHVLGGNQNNQVNIKPYPESRLLGVRRMVVPEVSKQPNSIFAAIVQAIASAFRRTA